jgi:hypothetical protein
MYPLPSLWTSGPSFFRWPSGGQGASIHAMDGRYHALIARSAATSRSKNGHVRGWSGYTPKLSVKADIPDGPFSATTGLMHCSKTACYSITSSASASSVDGTSIPSAFAILRLMLDVNLVGCSMGMSPGLVPLRILVDEIDGAAKDLDEVHAVTSEAPFSGSISGPIDGRCCFAASAAMVPLL